MLGTDLLYIDDAKRKSFEKRKDRLIEKVFTASESNLMNYCFSVNEFWLFWCLKETAYKYYQQKTGIKDKINPSAFQIVKITPSKAELLLPNQEIIEVSYREEDNLFFSWTGKNKLVHFSTEQVSEKFPFKLLTKHAFSQLLLKVKKTSANVPYFDFLDKKFFVSITHENQCKIISFNQNYLKEFNSGIDFELI